MGAIARRAIAWQVCLRQTAPITIPAAMGDLTTPIEAKGEDEIGVLARTFEGMRAGLETSRQEIEDRSRDIEQRNLELSALNTIATTVSQSLDLDRSLGATLDKVLSVIGSEAGGIFLREADGRPMAMKAQRGLSDAMTNLIFDWQQQNAQSEEISQVSQLSGRDAGEGEAVSFISVPLLSKGKLQGRLIMVTGGTGAAVMEKSLLLPA